MSHYLYLVRHGEQRDAEHGIADGPLSDRGAAQAHAVGSRLARVPFDAAFTSPLDRAVQTAAIMSQYLQGPAPEPSALLFDCVPSGPTPDTPANYESYFAGIAPEVIEAGGAQMEDAAATFLTREREDRHTLLVTHGFVIGWFVREVLQAPAWRWLTLQQRHAALSVIRIRTARPAELLLHNDVAHLDPHLRTGVSWSLPV